MGEEEDRKKNEKKMSVTYRTRGKRKKRKEKDRLTGLLLQPLKPLSPLDDLLKVLLHDAHHLIHLGFDLGGLVLLSPFFCEKEEKEKERKKMNEFAVESRAREGEKVRSHVHCVSTIKRERRDEKRKEEKERRDG